MFILSSLAGLFSPEGVKESLYASFSEKAREIEQALSSSGGYGLLLLPLIIFSNNLMVSLIMLALFPTIIGPWIFMAFQGFAVGAIIGYQGIDDGIKTLSSMIPGCVLSQSELSLLKAALLIPHGVFEIPGISVFMAVSINLSFTLIRYVSWRMGKAAEKPNFVQTIGSSLLALLIGVILLLVAAFVESFITPLIGVVVIMAMCPA